MKSEEKWAKNWVESVGEKKLEKALEKLRRLKGLKKQLMYKAVINYVEKMIGNE